MNKLLLFQQLINIENKIKILEKLIQVYSTTDMSMVEQKQYELDTLNQQWLDIDEKLRA